MKGNLLIIGGSGFIGRNLALKADNKGYKVYIISLNTLTSQEKINDFIYLQADITDFKVLKTKLSNYTFDYVVNLSGYIDHTDFLNGGDEVINVHFEGVRNLLKSIKWKR